MNNKKRVFVTCGHSDKPNFGKGKCRKCYMDEYRETHDRSQENYTEGSRARKKKWAKRHPEKNKAIMKASGILYRFGITEEEYKRRLASQNNRCALCGEEFYGESARESQGFPVLDHCHRRNKLREFLHRRCNLALGYLSDDPKICRLAAVYLEKHQEK